MKIQKQLGLWTLVALVVGSMIGGGVFDLPHQMAAAANSGPILIAWVITGIGVIALALVFQNLSLRKPELEAGVYSYARKGFGEYLGFFSAFGYWASSCVGNTTYWVLIMSTLGAAAPWLGEGDTLIAVGLSTLALPGLSPFVSEFLVLVGSFATQPAAAVLAALGVVLAALYILWLYQRAFTGPVTAGLETLPDASARERWVVGPLVAVMLVLGFVPGPALSLVREPAQVTIDQVGATDAPAVAEGSAQ